MPALTEGLTRLGIVRPTDPYLFLAEYLFALSPQRDEYIFVRKSDYSPRHETSGSSAQAPRASHEVAAGSAIQAARALGPEQPTANLVERHVQTDPMKPQTEWSSVAESHYQTTVFPSSSRDSARSKADLQGQHEEPLATHLPSQTSLPSQAEDISGEQYIYEGPYPEEQEVAVVTLTTENVEEEKDQEPQVDYAYTTFIHQPEVEQEQEIPLSIRLSIKKSGRSLAIKASLLERSGELSIDAFDIVSGERYHLDCEGVDYESLRSVYQQEHSVMVREMLRPIQLKIDPGSNSHYLSF